MVDIIPIDEIEKSIANTENACVAENNNSEDVQKEKSITEVSVEDLKVAVPTGYSEENVDAVVDIMSTKNALDDKSTVDVLTSAKRSQLIDRANAKVKSAQKKVIDAETDIQKAEHENFEGLLNTFGFFYHLPRWLTKVIVYILTPFFLLFGLVIGLPCGCVKILIDNIESIVTRYEKTDEKSKPRIKITILILLILIVVGAICLTVLSCLHII